MNIPYVMKRCNKCGRWLVASTVNFHRGKGFKYGLRTECKECKKRYHKQWHENNKDKIAEYHKQYYEDNRDKMLEHHKQYYETNKDKIAEQKKQYYEDNREKALERYKQYSQTPQGQVVKFNKHHRRRTKEGQLGSGITKDQWLEMMSFFDWKCAYSGETLSKDNRSIDHIVPLNSNGDNMIWNCVPMKLNYNSSKHDKDMLEWYRGQSFYDPKRLAKIYEWQEYARKKWKIS